jgi:hypothetical protein
VFKNGQAVVLYLPANAVNVAKPSKPVKTAKIKSKARPIASRKAAPAKKASRVARQ